MTTDEIRDKATQMLAQRSDGSRLPVTVVTLKDGTKFKGVLMERTFRPGNSEAPERLGFTVSDSELRYVPLDDIATF